jgi:hypothetical protein
VGVPKADVELQRQAFPRDIADRRGRAILYLNGNTKGMARLSTLGGVGSITQRGGIRRNRKSHPRFPTAVAAMPLSRVCWLGERPGNSTMSEIASTAAEDETIGLSRIRATAQHLIIVRASGHHRHGSRAPTYMTRVLLSPDVRHLATCFADHTARIWSLDTSVPHNLQPGDTLPTAAERDEDFRVEPLEVASRRAREVPGNGSPENSTF